MAGRGRRVTRAPERQQAAAPAADATAPADLGNFNPEGGPGNAAPVRRARQTQPLPTVEDEFSERAAQGRPVKPVPPGRGESIDDMAASGDGARTGRRARREDVEDEGQAFPPRDAADHEPDPSAIFGEPEDDDDVDDQPPAPGRGRVDDVELEERFLRLEQENERLRAYVGGGGRATGPQSGQHGAGTPQSGAMLTPEQVQQLLSRENLSPFIINEQTAEALGIRPEAAALLDNAFRQHTQHIIRIGAALFGSELARVEHRFSDLEPTRRAVEARTIQEAFYRAHPDLTDYTQEANWIWDQYSRSYPDAGPEQLIRVVGPAVRKHLQQRGVIDARGQRAPGATRRAAGETPRGMLGPQPMPRRFRPAVSDGGGPAGGRMNGNTLSPVQSQLAEMLAIGGSH